MTLYPPELISPRESGGNADLILRDRADDEFAECAEPFRAWLASHEIPPHAVAYIVATIRAAGSPQSGHATQRLAAATQALRDEYTQARLESFSDAEVLDAGSA